MQVKTIATAQIVADGPEAERFVSTFGRPLAPLRKSIAAVGLLQPPVVRRGDARWQVVCGWRRVCAVLDLGIAEIPVCVVDAPDETCMRMAVSENEIRGFNVVEVARAVGKFRRLGYSDERIASEVAPLIGIARSTEVVSRYASLLRLGDAAWRRILEEPRRAPQALLLAGLDDDDAARVFALLFEQVRVSAQEAKEIVTCLADLALQRNTKPRYLLDRPEAGEIVAADAMAPTEKGRRLRTLLRAWRYPTLTRCEERFAEAVRACGFPDGVRVRPAPFFERDIVTISISGQKPEELAARAQAVARALQGSDARGLFPVQYAEPPQSNTPEP